jgi:hypothetical protein
VSQFEFFSLHAGETPMYNFLLGIVIPLLSLYLGFETYPWWTIFALGAGAFLTYAMYHTEAISGAFSERGLGYLGTALVFNSVLPAVLFAIGRGTSYLVYGT